MAKAEETKTVPKKLGGYPVRAVHVEVVAGRDAGKRVTSGTPDEGSERIRVGTAEGNELLLSDPTVSRFHVEIVRRADRLLLIDHRSTNGTRIGAVTLRGAECEIAPGASIIIGETTLSVSEGPVVMLELGSTTGFGGVLGRSAAIRRLTASLEKLAEKTAAVLLVGESGVGKEVAARALHEGGPRRSGPFVTLDCGAIAPSLFVGELMGHERGAFTGADFARPGVFERAHGGTLLLDEIGELPLEHQSALLGLLERRKVRRLGGRDELGFDVRVVAATNRDLKAAVNAGTFRLDLYFRLAVVTLHVPPLRDRVEDIPILVESFLREEGTSPASTPFSKEKLAELARHEWPGNVRELKNFVLATLATGEAPSIEATGKLGPSTAAGAALDSPYRQARKELLEGFEVAYLRRLLERSQGNVREAARIAEMDRSYLIELLSRHGLR